MRHFGRIVSASLVSAAVLLIGFQIAAAAEKPGQRTPADAETVSAADLSQLRRDLDEMRHELRGVRATLERIERLMSGRQQPSEFSPVRIRVETEDGRPLAGFRVRIESDQDEGRRVTATGRSDETGLALSRELPYGDYDLDITGPSGWSTSDRRVTVELGAPLERTVIAPDPDERGSLKIRAALAKDAFQELRFGELDRETSGTAYYTYFSPDPEDEPGNFARFPTIGRGVSKVAGEILLDVERSVQQPDGKTLTWRWHNDRDSVSRLLLSADGTYLLKESRSAHTQPGKPTKYFGRDGEREEGRRRVGYLLLDLKRIGEEITTFDVAPGEVTVRLRRFLAKAEPQVVSLLDVEDDEPRGEVWLEANLMGESEWVPRLLVLSGWERSGRNSTWLAKKTVTIAPDETAELTIRSPDAASAPTAGAPEELR